MDAAEAWLAQNDPDYEQSRKAWRNLNDEGEYETPWREVPYGDAADVSRLIERGSATLVHLVENERRCRHCDRIFVVWKSDHVYCSAACRQDARPHRDRAEYQRSRRRRLREQAKDQAPVAWDLGVLPDDHPFAA